MSSQAQLRVVVIDDDSGFDRVLAKRMSASGWDHRILGAAPRPEELVAMKLHAVVLDPAVLGDRFWDYLETVAGAMPSLGIVVASVGSTVAQRVRALRLGADDWVVKPAHPEEVVARVEAVIRRNRRNRPAQEAGPAVVGEVEIRPDQFQAFVAGQSLDLTRREFELLQVLASFEGRVIERDDLYERVWGYAMARGDRSVDVFVRKLRQKLARLSPGWEYIHTHFGIGYRLEARTEDAESVPPEPAGTGRAAGDSGGGVPDSGGVVPTSRAVHSELTTR